MSQKTLTIHFRFIGQKIENTGWKKDSSEGGTY